jgi:hypothetical protein
MAGRNDASFLRRIKACMALPLGVQTGLPCLQNLECIEALSLLGEVLACPDWNA